MEPAKAAGRVRVNVGGRVFETAASTLASAGRVTMLGAMVDVDASWNASGMPEYFIDRDPACFGALLGMLCSGELHVPPDVPERQLFREALYYGLLDRVRAARVPELDGDDRLRLAASLQPPPDATAVRAAPDGGCCVAQGSTVRLYNWMLEELPAAPVRDAAYLDASTLVVGAGSGMAAFSTRTGGLTHHFRSATRSPFTPRALAYDDKKSTFASSKASLYLPSEHDGIGAWDCSTGEQLAGSFFPDRPGFAFSDAAKLQWLETTGALLVVSTEASGINNKDRPFLALLDSRDTSVVWSCSDRTTLADVVDAVMMEDGRWVCVVNKFHELGFLDVRKNDDHGSGVLQSWRPMAEPVSHYPKLAAHGGLLVASRNDTVSVYSGPHRVLTSTLWGSGGAIGDLAIGGDRLFALHNEENVVDVWEALPPPII
ncbi:hypothetical protein BRADI_4g05120v3 [Brachypodium distachyon]|uniref:BTB domain-containing protein n=1 Tax=Brachypodium distachyon TaxID=15368 RepID=A0A0Q3L1R3_BRADI|nr:hypothetical protein BRADI_4g05120v3 [Brachypodium distachyon]